ncbi:MAG: amino acid ABC transporter permease [Nitratireductor sp.]|nr:amino acid ABC transporter permease [Nitratireductor sp.]
MEFDTQVFWSALFSAAYLKGALITLSLTVIGHATAIVVSLPMALVLNGSNRIARTLASGYVLVFRAVPQLLLLLFVWNALPQFIPIFREPWFNPFLAAWLALSLNEAAYQVEINRSALRSVDHGQGAAGIALGLTYTDVFRFIVFPQAARIAIAPTVNEFITLLKITSLASVISLQELMTVTQIEVARTFQFSEYYLAALIYYLVMVFTLMAIQKRVERRFSWARSGMPGATGGAR